MTEDLPCIALLRPSIVMNAFSMPNPPIGLGYLASYLEREGFKVYIIDLTVRRITEDTLAKFLMKKNPMLIGISALTAYYNGMRDLSHVIKKRMPRVPIALGGVHVSMLPEVSLKECHADFVIEGEGEETLREL
ncbi:hypothetical protein GF325_16070, partial [Candidatus Bathyarchaeota archaeon]|nr:hypothetical protein [Candidatus Bathyarchaeota archaeon]